MFLVNPGNPPAEQRTVAAIVEQGRETRRQTAPARQFRSCRSGAAGAGAGSGGGKGQNQQPYYVVAQPVTVDVTEGTQVILTSGVTAGRFGGGGWAGEAAATEAR